MTYRPPLCKGELARDCQGLSRVEERQRLLNLSDDSRPLSTLNASTHIPAGECSFRKGCIKKRESVAQQGFFL